jgi:hypothetical protein
MKKRAFGMTPKNSNVEDFQIVQVQEVQEFFVLPTMRRSYALLIALTLACVASNALGQAPGAVPPRVPLSPAPQQAQVQPQRGSISGVVADQDGALIPGVKVALTPAGAAASTDSLTDNNGHFIFPNADAGAFQITLTHAGFATQEQSGVLHSGESLVIPQIAMAVATAEVDIRVLPPDEMAKEQVKAEETQRLFRVIPNFYVSYVPDAVALNTHEKFQLAWKTSIDPVSFGIVGLIAGIEQADGAFSGYGGGAAGFAKRYGAAYTDFVAGTFIANAILPSVLKQDPRYFYRGPDYSTRARFMYAVANSVICKGDNGHWQPNYSSVLGGLAAGGISNLYYPAKDRNGASLTIENGLLAVAGGAIGNVVQEFFLRKVTSHTHSQDSTQP